jgi:carboxymethylenebutenolidase
MTICEPESVDLPTSRGAMRSLIFRPTGEARHPAIVLYSEIFQITAPIRRTAAFLAGHGFIVAVPEVYHEFLPAGTVLAYDRAGADKGNELKYAKELACYDEDAAVLVNFLKGHSSGNGRVGAMGICLGGHLAFRTAMLPDVAATVCFYATDIHQGSLGKGKADNSLARIPDIRGELMMIWGLQDPHVPGEGRAKIYAALAAAGTRFTWHEFNAAHAFLRDEGLRYDAELAHLTLGMAVNLFRTALAV